MKSLYDFQIRTLQQYYEAYSRSIEAPLVFWEELARTFQWRKGWESVLEYDWSVPYTKWFDGAKLNITENCIDRHADAHPDRTAILWEPNNPEEPGRTISYYELKELVGQMANVLKRNGIIKGDRVCIYMPMIPELVVALLATARIGAIHSVVFAGFSSTSLATRINDSGCKMLITADGSYRGDKYVDLKAIADKALKTCPTIEKSIVFRRSGKAIRWTEGKDVWWHEEIQKVSSDCNPEIMESEDTLFILYTSGSTGKPKGMVHSCGGYMVYTAYSFINVFQYQPGDVYWCTADIGWITGHSYIVYGPLLAGATTLMFEGIPSFPDYGRFWAICEKYGVSQFYTAPTAIRSLEKHPVDFVHRHKMNMLRVLGTVGEPINEEAWHWYNENVGKRRAPIVDTWWQTETGGILISSIAGVTPQKPTYATLPMPGVLPQLVNDQGQIVLENKAEGILTIARPWPSISRTIYGDHERYKAVYFSSCPGLYFPGDGAIRDEDGNYRITGRVDDIVIVSGHNLGTAPIENAIDEHPKVVESAVVGFPHPIKGNALYAFVILYDKVVPADNLKKEILDLVSQAIGPIAKPDKIQFVTGLPKTRSGKIMRRILRKIASGDIDNLGDTSTLLNPEIVEEIKKSAQ